VKVSFSTGGPHVRYPVAGSMASFLVRRMLGSPLRRQCSLRSRSLRAERRAKHVWFRRANTSAPARYGGQPRPWWTVGPSRPIATKFSADIKCINYFRFCRFTYEQKATRVLEEIGKEGDELQRARRGGEGQDGQVKTKILKDEGVTTRGRRWSSKKGDLLHNQHQNGRKTALRGGARGNSPKIV